MRREAGGDEATSTPDVVLLACADAAVPRIFPDDILTSCCICRMAIYHRPGALRELGPGARAACLPCAARYQATDADQQATAGITRTTLDEVAAHLGERRR